MVKKKTQAAGKTGAWRAVNRVQLAVLMGCNPDTITDWSREGMPVTTRGGRGRESEYDAVACLDWWRERQGRNAKEAAQALLYARNAELAQLKIQREQGDLLSREDVIRDGQAFAKGIQAQIRALPRRARHAGIITSPEQEAGLAGICRAALLEVSAWKTAADVTRVAKGAHAA